MRITLKNKEGNLSKIYRSCKPKKIEHKPKLIAKAIENIALETKSSQRVTLRQLRSATNPQEINVALQISPKISIIKFIITPTI